MWVIHEAFDRATRHNPTMRGKRLFREALAGRASERLGVPYVAVDVGQLEDGSWVVIECGDAQFCGYCRVDVDALAGALLTAVGRGVVGARR